ncbi:MAG TPA: DmsC/YnfH family molybdoenzyme membrane anchor subunit [Stellaceae bacterium]|jgi:DMSO reductase anchor subunit|nr:DmsC/YnfH family molybdoenzyme membrane anchor subunit [Stellaceae bacterium]
MHPSFSVIFFTTASGAGYGLLALLGVLAPLGVTPTSSAFGFVALALALGGVTAGLVSSTFHLGHPERALRAFSQWRSSWLSREGVASVVTYVPAGLFAIAWVFFGTISALLGALAAIGAVVTVICTAMIYRSLKPIQRWHNSWVLPNYLALAVMTGALWLALLLQTFGAGNRGVAWLTLLAIVLAAVLKLGYWRFIDSSASASTVASATGLGALGTVRLFEAPHTSENYLLKEMGFRIARKHAAKLRRIAFLLAFALPFLLALVPLFAAGWPAALAALLAAPLATIGILTERWLFFAEAKHAVTLYYGSAAA